MKKFTQLILGFCLLLVSLSAFTFANVVPPRIGFEVKLANSTGLLNGDYFVTIKIGARDNYDDDSGDLNRYLWIQSLANVVFVDGVASFVLGDDANPIKPEFLIDEDTIIHIELDQLTAVFPLPSVPYSIYSQSSRTVEEIKAEKITGTFITTVNVQSDLIVSGNSLSEPTLHVDIDNNKVSIGKKAVQDSNGFMLDVNGNINAKGYFLNGQLINTIFSWQKKDNSIFYNNGNVGVGHDDPKYTLHVSGNISASNYYIWDNQRNGYVLFDQFLEQRGLSWETLSSGGLYYDSGNVGIGVSKNIVESLVVSGAIKLSESVQIGSKKSGTIEYKEVNGSGDFYGYINTLSGSTAPFSLTGLRLSPESSYELNTIPRGTVPYFVNEKFIDVTQNFVVSTNTGFVGVGIGTNNISASLTLSSDGSRDYLKIVSKNGDTLFVVNKDGKVGVGTSDFQGIDIQNNISLKVDGIVDASTFFRNGVPLSNTLAQDSFWKIGSTRYGQTGSAATDLFYDSGFVGIGTSSPKNMLELSSTTGKVAMTFDVDDQDMFTIGIASENSAVGKPIFMISEGGNLDKPIFSFSESKIGIGINDPLVTLHVSGNAGFLVEGPVMDTYPEELEIVTGSAMFYVPSIGAFRAGYASSLEWAPSNLGMFSSSFGYANTASGNYSFIGGGYLNKAEGNYSVIPGGINNIAKGDYSFAGGYYANAMHDGSFVWADITSSENAFSSSQKNQFLIRAYGGVGINTNQTGESALVVQQPQLNANIMELIGNERRVAFNSKGQLIIGTSDEFVVDDDVDDLNVAVSGRVGVGTTNPDALLHIENNDDNMYSMYVRGRDTSASNNVVVITNAGKLGVGTAFPTARLHVSGNLLASSFKIVDPDDPSKVISLEPGNGSPFSSTNSLDNNNFYRTQGFMGIGTRTPNTLVELSNLNSVDALPIITFDYNNQDVAKMGLITTNEGVFFAIASSANFTSENATFVITNNSVVIGKGARSSNFAFDVSGNVNIDGRLSVGSETVNTDYDMFVNGSLAVVTLNVNGTDFAPAAENFWKANGSDILYSSPNYKVAIGMDTSDVALSVSGNVKVNNLLISSNVFEFNGNLNTNQVIFADQNKIGEKGTLKVQDSELYFVDNNGGTKSLSSALQIAEAGDKSGPLAFWVDDTTLSFAPFYWDNSLNQLNITSNINISNYEVLDSGFQITSNVKFLDNTALEISSVLNHQGFATSSEPFTLQKLDLKINNDWGNASRPVSIRGIDLDMSNTDSTVLNNASVVGVYVDVTSVNVAQGQEGFVYAAKFLGGNVGIGVSEPTVALEVNGVVSASYFNLASGIEIPELIVNDAINALVVQEVSNLPRVGIGVANPSSTLEVNGRISANNLIVSGLEVTTINIGNGKFFVDAIGNIGIGTSTFIPSASFEINRTIAENTSNDYIGEKIFLEIDGVDKAGQQFYFNQNLTGLNLDIDSLDNSFFAGDLKGIDVDLVSVNLTATSKLYGIYVDVSKDQLTDLGTRYSAVFMGGNVGIGTTNPTVALDVSGSIRADNLILTGAIALPASITIDNKLTVEGIASINVVTVNSLTVKERLFAKDIQFQNPDITVDSAQFQTITAQHLTVNQLIEANKVSANLFESTTAFFEEAIYVNTDNIRSQPGLYVEGTIQANSATIKNGLSVPTFSVNEGDSFYVSDGKVGVGTKEPDSALHIVASPGPFQPTNTKTWNALKLSLSSNIPDQTVGILLSPDTIVSENIGSGILAQRKAEGASNLLFITDPRDATPESRMEISEDGTVYIGNNSASISSGYKLIVDGESRFNDDVSIDRLEVNSIYADSTTRELMISANEGITFKGSVNLKHQVKFDQGLIFSNELAENIVTSTIAEGDAYLYFYNRDLWYADNIKRLKISEGFSGESGRIPYFGGDLTLKDDQPLTFTGRTLTLGDSTKPVNFVINSEINNSQAVQEIIVTFDSQQSSGTTRFKGMDIKMNGKESTGLTTGYLGDGEVAVGLSVDVSALNGANNYAALFNGGNVGVGTIDPLASLHLKQTNVDENLLKIDTQAGNTAMFIDPTGQVSFGSDSNTLDSLVTIANPSNSLTNLFKISSSNEDYIIVSSDGKLIVNGIASINIGVFQELNAESLSIANGMFFVSSNGDVAIGTDNVNMGSVSIYSVIDSGSVSDYTGERLDVIIDFASNQDQSGTGTGPWGSYNTYESNLTGFAVNMITNEGNAFGTDSSNETAVGISVNMTNLMMDSSAKAYGLYVDVGVPTEGEKRYGAYFKGNVGINELNPTHALTVSGDVYSKGLIIEEGRVSINNIIVDSMQVAQQLDVVGAVNIIGNLEANTITVNELIVNQRVLANEGVYQTVTVNQKLYLASGSQLLVGSPSETLASSYIAYFDGNVTINGKLQATTLLTNTIKSNSSSNPTININAIVSTNQVISSRYITSNALVFGKQYSDGETPDQNYSLYTDGTDLLFKNNSEAINLTNYLSGDPDLIPFYNTSSKLEANTYGLKFNGNQLSLGGNDASGWKNLGMLIDYKVNGSVNNFEASVVSINVSGATSGNSDYIAQKITFESENYGDSSSTRRARLEQGDVAIGLYVDMKSFTNSYYGIANDVITPKHYAGLFNGGFVGIGTSQPQAALHVVQNTYDFGITKNIFRVDTNISAAEPAFLINDKGYLGLNTSNPTALLSIKADSDLDNILNIKDSADKDVLNITNQGVGIFDNNPSNGDFSVNATVNIKNGSNMILNISNNKMGVGHSSPTALLDIKKIASSNDHLLRINNGTTDSLLMSNNGNFYVGEFDVDSLGDSSSSQKMNVLHPTSSVFVVANDNAASSGLLNGDDYGFLSTYSNTSLFMGVVTENEAQISFEASDPKLKFIAMKDTGSTDVVTLQDDGIGILTDPTSGYSLAVTGNINFGNSIVFKDGNLGVGLTNPSERLEVNGKIVANELEVTEGGIKIKELDVSGKVVIKDEINTNLVGSSTSYDSFLVSVNLGIDSNTDIYGMKINLASNPAPDTDEDPFYLIAGNADAYGLYVDMSGLETANAGTGTYTEEYFGNKYAGVFKGGAVGIGTEEPKYPLHVEGQARSILAGFGGVEGSMVVRDWGNGVMGLNVVNNSGGSTLEHVGLTIKPSNADALSGSIVPAFVGIGTTNPDKALVVNGDMRLGVESNNTIPGRYGNYGSKLWFSGSPSKGLDSDNGDDLFMARYNQSEGKSQLRVNFSTVDDDPDDEAGVGLGDDMFVVGYTKSQAFIPVLKVHNNDSVTIWGDSSSESVLATEFIPEVTLHVRGNDKGASSTFGNYTALFERAGSAATGVLALTYSDGNSEVLSEKSKFIGFYNNSRLVGSIEGNNSGGIRYVTSGADYAEYLEKQNVDEVFEKGDIVAVVNGKITKDSNNFQQFMVLSSSASVAGNWPGENKENYELVAFYGQVPTKVKGKVKKGDFILASMDHDGVGVAKSKETLTSQDRTRIVGRAWEGSNNKSIKLINTAVGFAFGNYSLGNEMDELNSINQILDNLRTDRESLLAEYQETLTKQSQKIEELLLKIEKSR